MKTAAFLMKKKVSDRMLIQMIFVSRLRGQYFGLLVMLS